MTILQAIIIAIVEGITEFLPVSSTGHMIITQAILGMESTAFLKAFTVAIQFGAILSVVVLYYKHFFKSIGFYLKLIVAFIPAMVFGFLFNDVIDQMLESVIVVAFSLLIGGILLLFVDKWFNNANSETDVSYKSGFIIGLFQCIAMIPGVSRSAATIIGGLTQGYSRRKAAEFSFFLAVPTMFAATAYKVLKLYKENNNIIFENINLLVIGNLVAFVVALLAIKFFIEWLTKNGFKVFGWYRIILGATLLVLHAIGIELKII